jgi:hypothetical protein
MVTTKVDATKSMNNKQKKISVQLRAFVGPFFNETSVFVP